MADALSRFLMNKDPKLFLDADAHRYFLDGRPIPGVTNIINTVAPRNYTCGDWYLARGKALHTAIHLIAKGKLDWSSVDERILGRLKSLERFQTETGFQIAESEIPLASARYFYAGTIDARLLPRIDGQRKILCDFKSSLEPQLEPQIGAYSLLLTEAGERVDLALGLELREDGTYKCRWFTGPQLRAAEQTFLGMLTVYNFFKRNGLTNE